MPDRRPLSPIIVAFLFGLPLVADSTTLGISTSTDIKGKGSGGIFGVWIFDSEDKCKQGQANWESIVAKLPDKSPDFQWLFRCTDAPTPPSDATAVGLDVVRGVSVSRKETEVRILGPARYYQSEEDCEAHDYSGDDFVHIWSMIFGGPLASILAERDLQYEFGWHDCHELRR